jgi:hypothetical protein
VSQVVVEQAQASTSEARVSQVVVETATSPVIGTRVSQVIVEILTGPANPGPMPQPSTFTTRLVPIRWLRRGPIYSTENKQVTWNMFQVDAQVGVGTNVDPGMDPQVFMRYSNDYGTTWSFIRQRPMGRRGEYGTEIKFFRCGMGRSRVFEVYGSDPVTVALVNGYADVDPGVE